MFQGPPSSEASSSRNDWDSGPTNPLTEGSALNAWTYSLPSVNGSEAVGSFQFSTGDLPTGTLESASLCSPSPYAHTPGSHVEHAPSMTLGVQQEHDTTSSQCWDKVFKNFLEVIGFKQAANAFEADMMILNPEWERERVPHALMNLTKELLGLLNSKNIISPDPAPGQVLDKRKIEHVSFVPGIAPRTPTDVTRSISQFLARNRTRNDASNRNEFLLSIAEKRRRLNDTVDHSISTPSCARTDAKTQNRDIQMKYDIAKNEDGPLRKTMKSDFASNGDDTAESSKVKADNNAEIITAQRHPGLDERLRNIETHISVRYVPLPPKSLLDRLKLIEEHLIQLEKQYPPWAALHFNQPRRGWPPPPRPTPIIVPSHLTSTAHTQDNPDASSQPPIDSTINQSEQTINKTKGKQTNRQKSSLHRAVMEKLEVQKAMNDLAGVREEGT